jgi:C-terminal processing protease CtpA/Prc
MDWFTVYMNAYTEVFDPHTNYYSPKDKEDFDTQFTGKVIGIGALIQEKKEPLSGSPYHWSSGMEIQAAFGRR